MPIFQVVTLGATGKHMCEGEFESLEAIHAASPGFVPESYAWGKYTQEDPETYFLLAEFRDVGKQVRALTSAVFRYTHGKTFSPASFSCCLLLSGGYREASHLPIMQFEAVRSSSRCTVSRTSRACDEFGKANSSIA